MILSVNCNLSYVYGVESLWFKENSLILQTEHTTYCYVTKWLETIIKNYQLLSQTNLLYNSATSTLDKIKNETGLGTTVFITKQPSITQRSPDLEVTQVSFGRLKNTPNVVHIHKGVSSSPTEEINYDPFCSMHEPQ